MRQREPGQWYLAFKGIATYNSYGDPIDVSRAGRIAWAFRPALCFAQVHTAGFHDDAGFCLDCDAPYCYRHWRVSEVRPLPPRPRQEAGSAMVAISNRSLRLPDW